ncbi:MAG: hypothetical protein ACXVNM_01520 [Bacteroidia bacterium]
MINLSEILRNLLSKLIAGRLPVINVFNSFEVPPSVTSVFTIFLLMAIAYYFRRRDKQDTTEMILKIGENPSVESFAMKPLRSFEVKYRDKKTKKKKESLRRIK